MLSFKNLQQVYTLYICLISMSVLLISSGNFLTDEFEAIRWFGFNEIPYEISDPHMRRFLKKLDMKT